MAAEKIPVVPIPGTRGLPMIGLGTFNDFQKRGSNDDVKEAVRIAIDCGYRSFDTAYAYQTELIVGEVINEKIQEGVVKREDIFITTKLWNTHHNPAHVRANFLKSLKNLNCEYVDLYLIHWPFGFEDDATETFPMDDKGYARFSDHDYMDVWTEMEKLVDEGLVKAIGLSNFNKSQIERVLQNCRIKPCNLQIEVHPYLSNKKLIDFCFSKDISVTAYAPLGNPNRSWAKGNEPSIFEEPILKDITKNKNKSIAQVCLRFLHQRNMFQILDFELTDDEMKAIWSLDKGARILEEPTVKCKGHKYYPFDDEY